MCGIAGFLSPIADSSLEKWRNNLKIMTDAISHRGPDAEGHWIDNSTGFGHRRLSILDLSPTGAQPMSDYSGRFIISFNGEIYNFKYLKKRLDNSISLKGSSDTEVFLNHITQYGLEETLKVSCGMFGFSLWDKQEQRLHLVKDAMGEKNLFYGFHGESLLFASELKSILSFPGIDKTLNESAIDLFFKYNCIPAPSCILRGFKKLSPGEWLVFDSKGTLVEQKKHWDLENVAIEGLRNSYAREDIAIEELENTLDEILKEMTFTDVPYGAFLSGGIDSSAIVSRTQKVTNSTLKTFSIGFENKLFDESSIARKIAKRLETDHEEMILKESDCLNVIPDLAKIYCEPFSDSSQIPTFLVSKMARKKVTVALSGDGGDEMFGGYNRHNYISKIWSKFSPIPRPFRSSLGSGLKKFSPGLYDQIGSLFGSNLRRFGGRVHQISDILKLNNEREIYDYLVTHWKTSPRKNSSLSAPRFTELTDQDFFYSMLLTDQLTYLTDDICTKVDRAAMRNSLEVRIPFLDKRLVRQSWRIPKNMKIKQGCGKFILRELLYKNVPKEYYNMPKSGFSVPLETWLRGDLRDWAESLLESKNLDSYGLDTNPIQKIWREHLAGKANHQYEIWDVLMFLSWGKEYL